MSTQRGALGLIFLAALTVAFVASGLRASETAARNADYAKIDTQLCNEMIAVLRNGDKPEQRAAVARILAVPGQYPPIVLCVMAEVLFNAGEVDEAAFWFYASMLRIRFDAQRCADPSAREGVAVVGRQYGKNIQRYAMQDPESLERLLARVVDWDRKTPHDYDHRWVNLYGSNILPVTAAERSAVGRPGPMSVPRRRWDDLAEKNRLEYIDAIREVLRESQNAPANATARANY